MTILFFEHGEQCSVKIILGMQTEERANHEVLL